MADIGNSNLRDSSCLVALEPSSSEEPQVYSLRYFRSSFVSFAALLLLGNQ